MTTFPFSRAAAPLGALTGRQPAPAAASTDHSSSAEQRLRGGIVVPGAAAAQPGGFCRAGRRAVGKLKASPQRAQRNTEGAEKDGGARRERGGAGREPIGRVRR